VPAACGGLDAGDDHEVRGLGAACGAGCEIGLDAGAQRRVVECGQEGFAVAARDARERIDLAGIGEGLKLAEREGAVRLVAAHHVPDSGVEVGQVEGGVRCGTRRLGRQDAVDAGTCAHGQPSAASAPRR
jgi:hypothetical protein